MSVETAPVALRRDQYRQVLGHYPTGVCVITAIDTDGEPAGLTVGSFTSVSVDPPLVGFLPERTSTSWPRIEAAGNFCVNILSEDQADLCRRFAVSGPDKFKTVQWVPDSKGAPAIVGALATIECDLETVHPAGDHLVVFGRVRAMRHEVGRPLVFLGGRYGQFTSLDEAG